MAADFGKPTADTERASNLTYTVDNFVALAKLLEDASPTGVASGFKRWSAANKRLEQYNGSSWAALVDEMAQLVKEPAATVASAATVDLGAQKARAVAISGSTTITAFGTSDDGVWRVVRFTGALTLTHNASTLALPGAANITTANGDWCIANSLGSGNWRVLLYRTAGGNLIGSAPTSDLHLATKKYVDDNAIAAASETVAGKVELATSAEAQAGTDTTRVVTPAGLKSAQIITQTSQATTSGTYKDFTAVPAWVDRITVTLSGVSTNGTNHLLVQIGAGSITSSGYESNSAWIPNGGYPSVAGSTEGFISLQFYASVAVSGAITLTRHSGTTWVATGTMRDSTYNVVVQMAGVVTLGGTLDRVRLTTVGGTDTFDAGSVNVSWE